MACQHLTMSVTPSLHVHRLCMRCKSFEPMACVRRLCRSSSGQSLLPSCSTHPVPGVDLPKWLTGNELKVFFVTVSVVVTARLTSPRLLNNVPPLMKNSLIKSVFTITTYCTVSFLLLHLLHRATTFNLVRTVWNYRRNILAIWLTPISLHECFLLTLLNNNNIIIIIIIN